jgi:hypothetical protein
MRPILFLSALFVLAGTAAPALAGEVIPPDPTCYWCIRDAIYADVRIIARREANPDVDEAIKGPEITAARADIHRLRALLGPLVQSGPEPCCYTRPPLRVR